MIPIIDNWVLIADENNYTIARYFGEQTDSKGRVRRDLRNVKYYTSLVAAFNGLRGQLEHEILSEGFPSLCEAFRAVIESNARVTDKRFDPKPNISFKDALETLVMLPKGAYNDYFFKFGKADEYSRPFYYISFTDNNQMYEWRDAVMRCFDELMKLKKESGDFKEGNQDERM